MIELKEKRKLSVEEQIAHMRSKNIRFTIVNEEDAKVYLCNHSYYFRIKSYAKNYEKYTTKMVGKYIKLEFAYLQELSKLDMYFRELVLKLTIDIEHFLKVHLLRDFSLNPLEDGYSIIKEFFDYCKTKNIDIELRVKEKQASASSYCQKLILKYGEHPAIWNIIEVLSFGDFILLYEFYYNKYKPKENLTKYLWSVRILRNASAHNNCLLNSLRQSYLESKYNHSVYYHLISKLPKMNRETLASVMSNTVVNDFIVSLHLFCEVVTSEGLRNKRLAELNYLFTHTFLSHKEFFSTNSIIKTTYQVVSKIVDHYYNLHYSLNQ